VLQRLELVFIELGGGAFEPREVRTGSEGEDGEVEVLSGIEIGESVVTSGQFLLDSESRLREAVEKFLQSGNTAEAAGHQHHGH
jgi:Cu(I)/Ag(I) efflux system membrane fusion protein/cobalt-zinc-cadmium efflux system membrane fusion protein